MAHPRCHFNPLVHYGRHLGRTVHALCNVQALITNGILRLGELADELEESFTVDLLQMVPGLKEHLMTGNAEGTVAIAELVQKGAASARSDDTKSLKSAVIDWITPRGQSLQPPLACNVKINRGFHHKHTGALLCPAGLDWANNKIRAKLCSGKMTVSGDQWPIFLYLGYNYDPEDPWNGLLSVDKEPKATRSGNARIHRMTCVTTASITYVCFALSSLPVFSRTDTVTDSERFYNTLQDLLEDPEEKEEVDQLLVWWNRQVFPSYLSSQCAPVKDSALARIKERRVALRNTTPGSSNHSTAA
ncbi:hypothetical protein BV22DRAFT_1108331 [Leucogyrophana mollusca]|uniref:Uncharacterized protein n=1 Tax=Leucogyrophana mollusca TaxID=85980 RepID=A0ACB8AZX4_9AGAM|nr:hypothetical protein BV22DRAFT_1108331 [Leucogyrophana mollusca]